jgi:predicted metal-dependent hydrolase
MAQLVRTARSSTVTADVEVRRSARRRRTVSAYRDGDRIVVLVPARLSKADEQRLVSDLVERITRREANQARSGARRGDAALMSRARELSAQYLDGRPQPSSVRWVRNMTGRWGSCTMVDRTIRLSHRLQPMPSWVIDYVLVHELAHLLEPGHGPRFWDWVNRYPRTERARGYLEGVTSASQLPGLSDCESPEESVDDPPGGLWSSFGADRPDGETSEPSVPAPGEARRSAESPGLSSVAAAGRSAASGRTSAKPAGRSPSRSAGRSSAGSAGRSSARSAGLGSAGEADASSMLPVLAEPSGS